MKPAIFLLVFLAVGVFSYFYVEPVLAPTRYSSSKVTWSPNFPNPTSITLGNITLLCNVTEISQTIANYNFLYWFQYNTTPAGGWLNMTQTDTNFTLNTSIPITFTQPGATGNFNTSVESANVVAKPGSYMIRCQGNNGTSGSAGYITGNIINITVNPSYPQYSGNATSDPSGFGYDTANNFGFQITYTDVANDFANATFQLGVPAGTLTNYTQCGSSLNCTGNSSAAGANVWLINFTQDLWGKAGTYNYTWFGVDIDGYWNTSSTVNYVINKANTSMRLFLNGTENNNTYNKNDVANFTAYLNISKTITLRSNYTGFIDQTGTQTIFNYTSLGTTGNFFNLTAFWNGNENYTGSQKDYLFNVTAAGPTLKAAAETLSLSDSPSKGMSAFKSGADMISALESYPELQNLFRSTPESVPFADAPSGLRNVFGPAGDFVSFSDALGRLASLFRAQPEKISSSDSAGNIRSAYSAQSETISFSDIENRIRSLFISNAESLSLIDSSGKLRSVYLSQNELVSLSDIGSRIANLFRINAETISLYDAASNGHQGIFLLAVPETISFYDSGRNMQNLYLIQSELLNFNDIANRVRSIFRAQPETASAYDSVLGLRNVYSIQSELLNINDIAGRVLNLFRAQSEAVNIYDSGGKIRSAYEAQNELIGIGDIGSRILNLFRANTESLLISDTGIKIRYAYGSGSELINVYTVSSSIKNLFRMNGDSLTITDGSGKIVYLVRVSQDQISVFDGNMRLRGVYLVQSELLSFSDIANRILSLFRAQSETITVYDSASKSGGIQNILMSILENIGFSESPGASQMLFRSNSEIISLNDIVGRIRSLFRIQSDITNVYDSGGKIRTAYQTNTELISLNDISSRILNLFRANGETAGITDSSGRKDILFKMQTEAVKLYDSIGKFRGVYQAQNELLTVFDANSISRNFYRIGSELINLNDIANRMLSLFRMQWETVSVSDFATKQRIVNITSFTAQPSLYQNQYQTFDLTLNNTGLENVSVDYNISIFNSAGSVVDTVACPAATCPYNLAVGQTLISTTSWFTGSNAVGSYVAQANVSYGGASVSGNVSFSIVSTPSQPSPSPGGSSGSFAMSAPVSQPILPLGKVGVEFSGFTVLREITAGEAFAAGVRVRNSFSEPRRISVSVNGLPSSWVTITPEEQTVPANSEAVANILIATPVNIVPADYRVEMEVSVGGQTASKTFFILRVKNAPDILNLRPVVNREIRIDKATNETEVSIFVRNGKNPVQLTRVTERIPKALAQSVSDVSFDTAPSKILEKDPVVQWDIVFNPGEEDTKIIKYRVKKVLDDYSQYVYWNLEQMSVYPYLAGALPFSFHPSSNTLAKNQFNPVAIELANDGNVSFDATLSFDTPEGWVIIPKEVSRTVKPGESGSFPFEIKPEIATDGPYTLTLKAVLDKKTYSQQIDFYVTSFKPEQLILPAVFALLTVIAAYTIVRARTRRNRPRISHVLDVIRDR